MNRCGSCGTEFQAFHSCEKVFDAVPKEDYDKLNTLYKQTDESMLLAKKQRDNFEYELTKYKAMCEKLAEALEYIKETDVLYGDSPKVLAKALEEYKKLRGE